MALFSKNSIKGKLVLILIGLVIFSALLQSGAYILFQIKILEKDILRDLSVLSSSIGSTSRAAIIFEDKEAGKRILSSLSEEPQIDLAAIYDANKKLFVKYKRKESIPWNPPRLIGEGEMIDEKGIEIVKTIRFNEDVLGTIFIKANVKQLESHTVNYISLIGGIFLLIFLISIPLSMYLQRFISRPILALGETALNISKLNDYSLRAKYDQTNEIGVLYSEFNKMLSEIQTRDKELELYRLQLEDLVKERTKKLQETQKELLSKEKLAVMGTLSAMVSHELRNPLGTIRNSLFNVSQSVNPDDSDAVGEIKRIERNIVRCDNIIEELLDFARPPGDNFQPVDFDPWLKDIVEEQEDLKELNVHLELESNCTLEIDKESFRRAIINLVNNSAQAVLKSKSSNGDRGSEPDLSIRTRTADHRLKIIISDSGTGIDQKNLEKIFEPLFSTKSFGVGLGLPIVKGILEQHSGEIDIESTLNTGTTVTLSLPLN